MKTVFRRSPLASKSWYHQNAVMHIILACGVCFISVGLIQAIMYMTDTENLFTAYITQNIALSSIANYPAKLWTVITYGWFHHGFWEMLINMLWLYLFGSVFQMLMGYKQVIPLFVFAMFTGGVFYLLGQMIPGQNMQGMYVMGAQSGIIGFVVASLTTSPKYRYFFTEHFSVPLAVIAGIYILLMFLYTGMLLPRILLLLGGAAAGFAYVKLLRAGYKPGNWIYDKLGSVETIFTPNESKIAARRNIKRNTVKKIYESGSKKQKTIDDVLDKINQKGYDSLNKEEREILFNAGKDNN